MKWKQFFTPVKSFDAEQAKPVITDSPPEELTLLDVRQPAEYESGHIPGAKLIPLPDLMDRFDEIDPAKKTIVYCAVGGRSRVAAQMIMGKGFKNVINLSGGFKAWNGEKAFFDEEKGLEMFSGDESMEKTLSVAYAMEEGLREFYLAWEERVTGDRAKAMFRKLAKIEVKHKDRIFKLYLEMTGKDVTREAFESYTVANVVEGGLTSEEYVKFFKNIPETANEVIDMAMTIEAQALDLYLRAAERTDAETAKKALLQIAEEEKSHLRELGKLIDNS